MPIIAGFVHLPGSELNGKPVYVREEPKKKAAKAEPTIKLTVPAEVDAKGHISAIICTTGVVDRQDDVVVPGAFGGGKSDVVVSAWNHGSFDRGIGGLPVGVGTVQERGKHGIFEGELLMETEAARDVCALLKKLGGRMQWSFGFEIIRQHHGRKDGRAVSYLDEIAINEVSPVLTAASLGTRTTRVASLADANLAAEAALRHVMEPLEISRKHARRVEFLIVEAQGLGVDVPGRPSIRVQK
jgi:HK97 family phage prohead protease